MHQANFAGQVTPQTFTSISNKIVPENLPDTHPCSKTEKKHPLKIKLMLFGKVSDYGL